MPPLAAFACGGDAGQRTRAQAQAPAAAANSGQWRGRPLVGRAAGLVGDGLAAAFFASLELCACVEVRTADDLVHDCAGAWRDEAAPLMQHHDGRATARKQSRRTAARAGAGKGRRGASGLGCSCAHAR